ncbi:hypothetical protein GCM10011364_17250 [Mangrovimonas yunxiaonensis]|nr:hypothetical protein GCM10011364_17250 [Mangrovimonas yunxiaonensis]
MLKKQPALLAVCYTVFLTVISLVSLDLGNIKDVTPKFSDKIFHFTAYFVLTVLWVRALFFNFSLPKKRALLMAVVVAVIFGIIIEVLQMTLTTSRSFDFWDIVSNISGAFLALLLLAKSSFGTR